MPNTKTFALKKKINSPQSNIGSPVSVKPEDELEAQRIEENTEAMLRLVDYIFFLREDDAFPPS